MSIINDALKKAQTQLNNKETKKENSPSPEKKNIDQTAEIYQKLYSQQKKALTQPPKRPVSKGMNDRIPTVKIAATLCILLFIVGGLIYFGVPLLQNIYSNSKQETPITKTDTPAPLANTRTYAPDELVLTGISIIENKRVAIINGEIYEEGEHVLGKKITKISMNEVALVGQGKELKLRIGQIGRAHV